jgi:hypothetical protein
VCVASISGVGGVCTQNSFETYRTGRDARRRVGKQTPYFTGMTFTSGAKLTDLWRQLMQLRWRTKRAVFCTRLMSQCECHQMLNRRWKLMLFWISPEGCSSGIASLINRPWSKSLTCFAPIYGTPHRTGMSSRRFFSSARCRRRGRALSSERGPPTRHSA